MRLKTPPSPWWTSPWKRSRRSTRVRTGIRMSHAPFWSKQKRWKAVQPPLGPDQVFPTAGPCTFLFPAPFGRSVPRTVSPKDWISSLPQAHASWGCLAARVSRTTCRRSSDMYVAVKGGEQAIDNAHALLAHKRRGDQSVPELSVEQIRQQMPFAVSRVMAEASLYDEELAALAVKQAAGELQEAIFLLRA